MVIQKPLLRVFARFLLIGGFVSLALNAWAAGPTINAGSASGQAGTTVTLSMSFNPSTASVAGMQFNLTIPAGLSTGTLTAGNILNTAGKSVSTNLSGTTWSFIIFGINQNTISSGTLLTAQLSIAPGTAAGNLNLPISNIVYSDINGDAIPGGTSTGGTVTVVPPAPVITSTGTATGQVGVAFNYTITASNSPTSFGATGLPGGLSINTTSGLISGTPTSSGTFSVGLSAINAGGTGTKTLSLTIKPATPVITSTGTASGTVGTAFTYQITATNSPTSYGATSLPGGLSINTGTGLISGTPTTAGTSNITLSATNAGGTGTKGLTLTVISPCDLNTDGIVNIADVQLEVNMALGITACTQDLTLDGNCNILDIQRIVNTVLGGQCVVGP